MGSIREAHQDPRGLIALNASNADSHSTSNSMLQAAGVIARSRMWTRLILAYNWLIMGTTARRRFAEPAWRCSSGCRCVLANTGCACVAYVSVAFVLHSDGIARRKWGVAVVAA